MSKTKNLKLAYFNDTVRIINSIEDMTKKSFGGYKTKKSYNPDDYFFAYGLFKDCRLLERVFRNKGYQNYDEIVAPRAYFMPKNKSITMAVKESSYPMLKINANKNIDGLDCTYHGCEGVLYRIAPEHKKQLWKIFR